LIEVSAMNVAFLRELLGTIADRGRAMIDPAANGPAAPESIENLCRALLSARGEASGIALASAIVAAYTAFDARERLRFFDLLKDAFGPDRDRLKEAATRYAASGEPREERVLLEAAEPRRQELIRRLNLAPGNTGELVAMRAELLAFSRKRPDLLEVDADFAHLFGSWFNRGFLVMQRIDWSTSASILERIIRYEAVHKINGWEDLRRRIDPIDRRCYAFFHPALVDEPLIFVEVALTRDIPSAIAPLLEQERDVVPSAAQTTAVFYSISNTQVGLRGVSFGNFLIKQVAYELKRDLPSLKTFVTLSPVPGFASWLQGEREKSDSDALTGVDHATLALLDEPGWAYQPSKAKRLERVLMPIAAHYFLQAKDGTGRPADPVARFHLGNGARLERLNWLADTSEKAMRQSHGIMVNYLYSLPDIERNHEAYSNRGMVAASRAVRALLESGSTRLSRRTEAIEDSHT
jgi:malonyl-CoA decarboxylase